MPGIKGATASAQVKPATLETGLVIQVPPFVNEGDKVRVNTETGEYQSRVGGEWELNANRECRSNSPDHHSTNSRHRHARLDRSHHRQHVQRQERES